MTVDQFAKLLQLVEKIADRKMTIAGAADWPMFVAISGIVILLIAFMWRDLRAMMARDRDDMSRYVDAVKSSNNAETDKIWKAITECQHECCPRRKNDK